MKKKFLAVFLVLSLLLVFSSSAFATSFDGKCTNYFYTCNNKKGIITAYVNQTT